MSELAYIVLMGLIQSYVKIILWVLINYFLVMTFENDTFYRIEAFQFDLSTY